VYDAENSIARLPMMRKPALFTLVGRWLVSGARLSALVLVSAAWFCSAVTCQTTKPKIRVAPDGFPTGHDTPEGVASDIARALINRDVALFNGSCVRVYAGGKARDDYSRFLQTTVENIKREAAKKVPSPYGPKSIAKVFAARHLTSNGPASYGYAGFDFQDIMFVDVLLNLQNGERSLNRTMVIKDRDAKWYVHPVPDVSPLLSQGLNEEKASVQDFSEVYDL
jgi:hypothetical protein